MVPPLRDSSRFESLILSHHSEGCECNPKHQITKGLDVAHARASPTKGPMWLYPVPVLGAISPFLGPFRGRLSPNIDNVSEKMTLRYPHEGPWVGQQSRH